MRGLLQDLRLALRQLRNAPGFAVAAVLTLAVGIGATTAIFTLVYDVMLRPLPYAHAERMVVMEEVIKEFHDLYPTLPLNANNFLMWQKNNRSFAAMTAMDENTVPLGVGDHPLEVKALTVTPGFWEVVGATPAMGRAFGDAEAQAGRDHVVVLMNSTWRDQFQSDPNVIGRTATLNGFPYTVIGVMPESFHLPPVQAMSQLGAGNDHPIAAIVPRVFSKEEAQQVVGDFNYIGLGLLKPGVSVAQASDEINGFQRTITAGLSGDAKVTLSAVMMPFQQKLVGTNRKSLLILLGAVVALLLVGCVNITNLLLARATSRRQQMAVASALGARRSELIRLAMRETIVLSVAGGALGILLAAALVPFMQQYLPPVLNFRGPLHLDWAGAACAVLLAGMAALLSGAVPAWMGSRTQPAEVLHSESRLASESRSSKRVRRVLVAAEVAVSVVLVLMTGLLTLSLTRMMHVDHGFETQRTMTAEVALPRSVYTNTQQRQAFFEKALDRLRQLPGVVDAGSVSKLPLAGDGWIDMIRVVGDGRPAMQLPTQHFREVSPGYFQAIHLPLVAGRQLNDGDKGKRYALVSEMTAKAAWPGKDAVGQTFTRGGVSDDSFTVIGVVKDARTISLAKPDPMMVYVPYWFRADNSGGLVLSTRQDPSAMADAIRRAVWSVDPAVAVPTVRALGGIVEDSVANRRFEMDLLLLFAVSALLLAGLGIYGVVTYSVVQREREIGLRMALGAQAGNIYRLVMREGMAPVLAGAVVGIAGSLALARVFRSMLFEVSPYQPGIVGVSLGVLVGIGVMACLLPARRAARVEPMAALRAE
ncbi:MAG: ABC transporter permease [Edaphobacter sp.]|uniref:ABC transporter permease n=1 Tax=Edaphobacter sp. TaxID=1934404 RepID=UPI002385680A|nr:ABC transporter permease [Edaphobacter sp.]MDE1178791.1 ABC transporter permease [Edaphobacter sp.]